MAASRPGTRSYRVFSLLCLLLGVAVLPAQPAAAAIAPGCTAARPTFVGGTIVGYPDGRALNVHIGVSVGYRDATGRLIVVAPDGGPADPTLANYSWIDYLNQFVPATGTTDPAADRTWGMCVAANVRVFYAEAYPKAPGPDLLTQRTDKSRYGAAAYYAGTVTPGTRLNVGLREPVTWQAEAGNTGGLQGYITYQGRPVPVANVARIRAFPGPGAPCGVEGFSAAADQLQGSADGLRTYYKMDYLAGGRCGATYQAYNFQVTCTAVCGAATRVFVRAIKVTKAKWPRFDVTFT